MGKHAIFVLLLDILQLVSVLGDNLVKRNLPDKRRFQVIKPVFYHNRLPRETTHIKNGTHLKDVTLYFQAYNRHFLIDLTVNRYLFSKNFIEKKFHDAHRYTIHKPNIEESSHCFYHGSLRGFQHSIVAVSTCDGIRGLISDGRVSYHIDPSREYGRGRHKLYIEPDDRPTPFQRRGDKLKHSSLHANATLNYLHTKDVFHRVRREIRGPYDSNNNARFVEMYIVTDQRLYRTYSRQDSMVIQRAKDIVNIVSKLYNPLNIYIALVGVEIWTTDKIRITSQANNTLEEFLNYRKYSINPKYENDNAQLITGQQFTDNILGRAFVNTICTFSSSGGVVSDADVNNRLIQVATTVAHELGHNLGMAHDNYSFCKCPDDKCIMAPTQAGISPPTKWSSCSQIALAENFEIGMDYCLKNKPDKLFEGPVCGNGFVEPGEECDCGIKGECKTTCCNALTCKLSPGAVCATGKCCDTNTCTLKPRATLCRGAYEECDLPEFCNGESEYCPSDVYRKNGIECGNGQSYCLNGKCKTHTGQCRLLWGATGRVSDPICFQHLNVNGSETGNCGYNLKTNRFTRCDKDSDVMCGLLHCVHLNEKLMFWRETLAIATPASFLQKGSKVYVCRSATLDVGLNMPDPGQVPDGAKCGHNKICYNHKCTSLARIPSRECPDCHSNGVCNSIGQCHCNEGFSPPFCDAPGYGGSLHSGPIKIKDNNDLLIGLLVTFAMIIVFGCLAFIAFYYRESIKKWWINHPGDLKFRVPCFSLSSWKRPANGRAGGAAVNSRNPNIPRDISTPVFQSTTATQSRNRTIKTETSPEKVALKPQSKSKTPVTRPDPPKFFKKTRKQEPDSATYQNVAVKLPPSRDKQQESSFQEVKLNPVPSDTKESKSIFSKFSRKTSKSEESKKSEEKGQPSTFTPSSMPIVKPGAKAVSKQPTTALKPTPPASALKPTGSAAALKPTGSAAALKPTGSAAALKPTGSAAALKPTAPSAALKPSSPAPALKPVIRQNSNPSNPSVTRQDSNSSGSGVAMRKERVSREISNPVLISTTDRRSQAFVQDKKDGQLVPPVPAHSNRNSSSSSSSNGKSPSRPKSMPLQAQKLAFPGDQNQKAAEEPILKSPQRPPPSYEEYLKNKGPADKKAGPSPKLGTEVKDEVTFPLAKNRNPVSKFGSNLKEEPSRKPLLPKVKSTGQVMEQDSNGRRPKPSRSPPKPGMKLPKKPVQASSSLEKTDSFEKVQEAPAVAHIKAMFDSMDVGKKSVFGSDSSLGQVGTKSQPVTGETRPKPSPKPGSGSKIRSVNV
ncbi:disintegrin and metalloproteinase domain-containing protein 12-like isoform X1 [Saccostrea echinata]|uniref:disintegrin and metalloproteinase domain-containing protein 12-like isoform X1 n=1 Tax=Saccostrea echinata TaxID=191078 RepID=UPI002A7FD432|nr:disintegrin and metalloproteinase domain-containing protein 12-like isoform X1 [Saccostrea echinata]